jgi:hypothetical protein
MSESSSVKSAILRTLSLLLLDVQVKVKNTGINRGFRGERGFLFTTEKNNIEDLDPSGINIEDPDASGINWIMISGLLAGLQELLEIGMVAQRIQGWVKSK